MSNFMAGFAIGGAEQMQKDNLARVADEAHRRKALAEIYLKLAQDQTFPDQVKNEYLNRAYGLMSMEPGKKVPKEWDSPDPRLIWKAFGGQEGSVSGGSMGPQPSPTQVFGGSMTPPPSEPPPMPQTQPSQPQELGGKATAGMSYVGQAANPGQTSAPEAPVLPTPPQATNIPEPPQVPGMTSMFPPGGVDPNTGRYSPGYPEAQEQERKLQILSAQKDAEYQQVYRRFLTAYDPETAAKLAMDAVYNTRGTTGTRQYRQDPVEVRDAEGNFIGTFFNTGLGYFTDSNGNPVDLPQGFTTKRLENVQYRDSLGRGVRAQRTPTGGLTNEVRDQSIPGVYAPDPITMEPEFRPSYVPVGGAGSSRSGGSGGAATERESKIDGYVSNIRQMGKDVMGSIKKLEIPKVAQREVVRRLLDMGYLITDDKWAAQYSAIQSVREQGINTYEDFFNGTTIDKVNAIAAVQAMASLFAKGGVLANDAGMLSNQDVARAVKLFVSYESWFEDALLSGALGMLSKKDQSLLRDRYRILLRGIDAAERRLMEGSSGEPVKGINPDEYFNEED